MTNWIVHVSGDHVSSARNCAPYRRPGLTIHNLRRLAGVGRATALKYQRSAFVCFRMVMWGRSRVHGYWPLIAVSCCSIILALDMGGENNTH